MLQLGFELVEQYSREEAAKPMHACSVDDDIVTAADDDDAHDADECAPSGSRDCNSKRMTHARGEPSTMHLLAALVEVRDMPCDVTYLGSFQLFFRFRFVLTETHVRALPFSTVLCRARKLQHYSARSQPAATSLYHAERQRQWAAR